MKVGFRSQVSQPLTLSKSAEFIRIRHAYNPNLSVGATFLISSRAFVLSSAQDNLDAPLSDRSYCGRNLALFPGNVKNTNMDILQLQCENYAKANCIRLDCSLIIGYSWLIV